MKRILLGLSIVLIAGALALLWLSSGDDAASAPAPVIPRTTDVAAVKGARDDTAVLLKAGEGEPRATRTTVEGSLEKASRTQALLDGATWVEVEVRLPRGSPADEKIELDAVVFAPDRFADDEAVEKGLVIYREVSNALALDLGQTAGSLDEKYADVLPCEAIGANRFRAPFPKGSMKGLLRLRARYAYVADLHIVELPSPAIRLEPALGAWLTARLHLPGNLPNDIDPSALEPFEVEINGFRLSADGERYGASTKFADDLDFEFGGLPPGLTYLVQGRSPQFTAFRETQLTPRAGEHVQRSYDLRVGAFVSGRIVDESGVGLANAKVEVRGKRQRGFFGNSRLSSSRSDAGGRFVLRAIDPGKTTITASLDEYVVTSSEELELADGQRLANLDLVLSRGKTLSGRIVWPDGKPAAGVQVDVFEREAKRERRSRGGRARADAKTNDDGRFSLSGFTAETAGVHASLELKAPQGEKRAGPWSATREDVALGVELLLTLVAPHEVRGRVVDDLGAPIASFTIEHEPVSKIRGSDTKDTPFETVDGAFTLMLAVGTHELSAKAAEHGASPKQELTLPGALDVLTFTLPRAAAISGVVLDPTGLPVAGASVENEGAGNVRWLRGNDEEANKTDAQGRFALKCATPGNVMLVASQPGFAPSVPQAVQVIPGQPITDIVLSLRIGGRLEGEIYTTTGAPDAGRQIVVGNFMGGGSVHETVTSDVAGHFVMEHLPPGKHSVMAIPKMEMIESTEGDVDETEVMSSMKMTTVDIVDGQTSHIVLGAPSKAPVRLNGRVTQGGKPYSEGVVMAIADGKAMLDSMKLGKLDGDGNYAITLDAPGDYTIIVGERMGDDQAYELEETIPEVREHRLDIELPQGGIRGRVTTRDGKPLANVPILLETEGHASIVSMGMGRSVETNESGRFEIKSLKPGTYTLRTGVGNLSAFGDAKPAWGVGVRSGLVVEADRVLDGVELRLDPAGSIQGTVRGADGNPAADAVVFVRDSGGRLLNPMSRCTTDGLGKFVFEVAPRGTCTVSARSGNLSSRESGAVSVSEAHAAEVELRLEPGTMLLVSVEGDGGKAVRAGLRVVDEHGRDVSNMMSDDVFGAMFSEGYSSTEKRIGPLPGGKYRVTATASDGSSVTRPVTLSGQEERALRIRLKD